MKTNILKLWQSACRLLPKGRKNGKCALRIMNCALIMMATTLMACSDDDFSGDPSKDWNGTTTFFASTDAQGLQTYYTPAVGRVGDPMPFYDQKAGDF